MNEFEYKDARKFFTVNQGDGIETDKDLTPIVIRLPDPPKDLTTLKNYGLHPDDQVYVRDEVPVKLLALTKRVVTDLEEDMRSNVQKNVTGHKIVKKYWDVLEVEREEYALEIDFIKKTVWKCVYGEWVYIDGEPIYISPWHYEYLNFWFMPDVIGFYPEFRDRDWRTYCFNWYLYTTTETFANLDDDGNAIKEKDGSYRMRDTGNKVFYGSIQPKNRRSGATHMALEIIWAIIRKSIGKHGTMISKSVPDVEKHFQEKFIPAWQKYPMFLKPTWDGDNDPGTKINLKPPSNDYSYKGLKSSVFYSKTTSEGVIDSQKIAAVLFDEQGKPTGGGRVDVFERWETSKQTMSQGNGAIIEGFCLNPSTCEEMEDGAVNYKAMCDLSNFYMRLDSGQTKSGLALLYFPAQVGLEGFIGPFGETVIQNPTERQIRLSGGLNQVYVDSKTGSREYLSSERNRLLNSGTPADMRKYRSLRRKHPMYYAESWIGASGGMGWDLEIIERRLIEHNRMKVMKQEPVKRGNFYRAGGNKDGRVEWVTDPENGKFEMAMDLVPTETNLKNQTMFLDIEKGYNVPAWEPVYKSKYTCGGDPFDYGGKKLKGQANASRQSDGGIAILWEKDEALETSPDMLEWDSRLFVLSYRHRPKSMAEYNEDVLMACVYFGAMFYPERNKTNTWEHFVRRGYGGYLKYDINPLSGKREDKPGFYSLTNSKNDLFSETKDYINYRGHKELFASYLREVKDMTGPEDMTKLDRFTAHGAALLGSRSSYARRLDAQAGMTMNTRNSSFFRKFRV